MQRDQLEIRLIRHQSRARVTEEQRRVTMLQQWWEWREGLPLFSLFEYLFILGSILMFSLEALLFSIANGSNYITNLASDAARAQALLFLIIYSAYWVNWPAANCLVLLIYRRKHEGLKFAGQNFMCEALRKLDGKLYQIYDLTACSFDHLSVLLVYLLRNVTILGINIDFQIEIWTNNKLCFKIGEDIDRLIKMMIIRFIFMGIIDSFYRQYLSPVIKYPLIFLNISDQ